jgi:chemotaxis protein methyltransferase CheR
MSRHIALSESVIDQLSDCASAFTGFSREAMLPEAIRRAAVDLLNAQPAWSVDELLRRALARDGEVVHALCQAVSVGETFFFRHPDHFRFLSTTLLPALLRAGRPAIRAWSAGCASGEEAYSLAACLLDAVAESGTPVSVLGTDLLERNLQAARLGVYGLWSRRPSGPLLHPLFHPDAPDKVAIDARVRSVARFQLHNLLAPMAGEFEVIFCRNVLVYFAPEASRRAVAHLAAALAPGGALVFGSMDLSAPPPGLVPEGLPELQIFRRPLPAPARAVPLPPQSLPTPTSVPRLLPPEPVAMHLKALVLIERGDKAVAEQTLSELIARVPDYVPGLLERAMLHVRLGQRNAAVTLMREVLRRTDQLPPDALLPGPEPLPVSFYRDSAQTFLRRGAE